MATPPRNSTPAAQSNASQRAAAIETSTPPSRSSPARHAGLRLLAAASGLLFALSTLSGFAAPGPVDVRISLQECVVTALSSNRVLQIERINPLIARLALSESLGHYDPILAVQLRREEDNDTGGYDPADFSRDAVYSADSEVGTAGLIGFLPSGLSYSLGGTYAHSSGTRNFMTFESYKLGLAATARQPLLRNFWTDAARTSIKLNRKLVRFSDLGVRYLVLDILNQVHQAYFDLAYAWEDLQVRQRLLTAKDETLAAVRRQVEVGTLTILDEKLALAQSSRVESDLAFSSNLVVQAENTLKSLLGYGTTEWAEKRLVPSDHLLLLPETLDLAHSWRSGFARRPDLAQMQVEFERADINLRFRRNQLFPSLDIIGGYGRRGASAGQALPPVSTNASFSTAWEQIDDGDAPNAMVGLVLTTPLGMARERAAYRAGRHLKEQAQLRIKQKEEIILREVSDAHHAARLAFDRVQASRRARAYAHDALLAEEQKLAAGSSALYIVLQLQSDLAAAESNEVRARADYNKALSQLHFAEGTLIERTGLNLDLD